MGGGWVIVELTGGVLGVLKDLIAKHLLSSYPLLIDYIIIMIAF
jgi:hypothetical protein